MDVGTIAANLYPKYEDQPVRELANAILGLSREAETLHQVAAEVVSLARPGRTAQERLPNNCYLPACYLMDNLLRLPGREGSAGADCSPPYALPARLADEVGRLYSGEAAILIADMALHCRSERECYGYIVALATNQAGVADRLGDAIIQHAADDRTCTLAVNLIEDYFGHEEDAIGVISAAYDYSGRLGEYAEGCDRAGRVLLPHLREHGWIRDDHAWPPALPLAIRGLTTWEAALLVAVIATTCGSDEEGDSLLQRLAESVA